MSTNNVIFRSVTALLLVFMGISLFAVAEEYPVDLSALFPALEQAGIGSRGVYVLDCRSLDEQHDALMLQGTAPMPKGMSYEEAMKAGWRPDPLSVLAILRKDNNALQLSITAALDLRDPETRHGDARHLVYREAEWSDECRVVYFDLEKRAILSSHKYPQFGVDLLGHTASVVLGTNGRLSPVLELTRGQFPKSSGDVKIVVSAEMKERDQVRAITCDEMGNLVCSSSSASFRYTGTGWTRRPLAALPDLKEIPAKELWNLLHSPEMALYPEYQQAVLDTGVSGLALFNRDQEILEVRESSLVAHPLPSLRVGEFLDYFPPQRLAFSLKPQHAALPGHIGPIAYAGERLYFGFVFELGEYGESGGIGVFDSRSEEMSLKHYEATKGYCVSALAVDEKGSLWIGLFIRGYEDVWAGGLLRFDPKRESFTRYEIEQYISTILADGDLLYLGTTDGLMVLRGEDLAVIEMHPALGAEWTIELSRRSVCGVPMD